MAKSFTGLDYTNVRTGGWVELEDRALIEEYKKGGTLPEISIALTKRLKRPITASAIKDRAYYLRLRGVEIPQLPRSRPSLDKPEPATPLNPLERRAALDKAAVARKEMEGLVDQVNEFKARQAFLDAAAGFKAPPVLLPREKKSGIRELCPIVLASDWHVEENVDPESVARRNIYSLEIAEERMERFWQGIMWNIEHHRASGKVAIRDLVLWLGGDLITGYIHPELVEIAELSPTGAIRWLISRLRNGIATLLERLKLDRLVIPCSYGNHGRCHDDTTELLTARGWRKYNEITKGDLVATYRMSDGAAEWQPLQDVYVAQYDGPMVAVTTKTADFMVTPRHRMVVKSAHHDHERFVEIQEFLDRETLGSNSFPKCAVGHDEEYREVSDDELTLIGWVMTDGCYPTSNDGGTDVRIYQSKPEGVAAITALLKRLGLEFSTFVRERDLPIICGKQVRSVRPDTTFNIFRRSTPRLLHILPDKHTVPAWMQRLSRRQFDVFLDGLMAGDGHTRGREEREIERVLYGRREFLDQIQALAVVNGIPARVREDNRGNFILSLPTSRRIHINDWSKSVKILPYSGVIWCGTVANGTLITRRNGIPLVSGNTTDKTRIATGAHNSFEWLMYHMIANEFRDEERIVFEITASAHQYVDVFGSIVHFHHGDEVRYNGGIGGLGIPLLKAIPSWELVKPAALHCLGHHHTLRDFGRAVVNGSLIGYTPYSQSIRCEFELPQQAMFFWDRSRGKCMFTPLWVSDLEKDKKRGIGINAGT
jgi:hypothetical protein